MQGKRGTDAPQQGFLQDEGELFDNMEEGEASPAPQPGLLHQIGPEVTGEGSETGNLMLPLHEPRPQATCPLYLDMLA